MVRQIKMPLESKELDALGEAAQDDLRSVGNQARYLVRSALKDRGLLEKDKHQHGGEEVHADGS